MYSQDGMGLGHLRRSSNIAGEILRQNPKCEILILADSPAVSLFSGQRRIEFVKLPTVVKTGATSWRNGTLSLAVDQIVALRARVILETFCAFEPDTVLIDHMPVGVRGELKPLLDRAKRRRPRPTIFLGLRDVLDAPDVIRRVWTGLGVYQRLPDYDAVLIYGSPEIYDAATEYRLRPAAGPIFYCGYVSPQVASPAVSDLLAEPYVLMMGGGGEDAFPIAQAFVDAIPLLGKKRALKAVLLTGPNMPSADRDALKARAGSTVRIEEAFGNAVGWIRGASALVTMGGYNSLCEILKWRKRAVVVPRPGPSAEQRIRSELFSARSLARACPLPPDPHELARKLAAVLDEDELPDLANIPLLDGAQRSAAVLLGSPTVLEETEAAVRSVVPFDNGRRLDKRKAVANARADETRARRRTPKPTVPVISKGAEM
jgi:predicted glycosyltransferase